MYDEQHCNKIIPYLYLGDANFLYIENKPYFDLVINCCPELGLQYTPNDTKTLIKLRFADDPDDNTRLLTLLRDNHILEQIHDYVQNGKSVMIHCAMGMQRSPTIIACYLLRYYNAGFETVVQYIKQKRPEAFATGYNFREVMMHYNPNAVNF